MSYSVPRLSTVLYQLVSISFHRRSVRLSTSVATLSIDVPRLSVSVARQCSYTVF